MLIDIRNRVRQFLYSFVRRGDDANADDDLGLLDNKQSAPSPTKEASDQTRVHGPKTPFVDKNISQIGRHPPSSASYVMGTDKLERRIGTRSVVAASEGRGYGRIRWAVGGSRSVEKQSSSTSVPPENDEDMIEGEPQEKRMRLRSHTSVDVDVPPGNNESEDKRASSHRTLRSHAVAAKEEAQKDHTAKDEPLKDVAIASPHASTLVNKSKPKSSSKKCPHVFEACSVNNKKCGKMAECVAVIQELRGKISGRFHHQTASMAVSKNQKKLITMDGLVQKILEKQQYDFSFIGKATKLLTTLGYGSYKLDVWCLPGEDVPPPKRFTLTERNMVDKSLTKEPRKITDCGDQCANGCGPACPCVISSIVAGRAFFFNGYLQADCITGSSRTGFHWTTAVNCCSEKCRCKGRCTHGVLSQELVTTAQLRYIGDVGFGVFAIEPILKGKVVFEFTGRVATAINGDKAREYAFQISAKSKDHVAQDFDNYWNTKGTQRDMFVDPMRNGNIARFVNHGEAANLAVIRSYFNDHRPETCRLYFYANRDIPAGTELLIDYGPGYLQSHFEGKDCLCRHPICQSNPNLSGFTTEEVRIKNFVYPLQLVHALEKVDKVNQKNMENAGIGFSAVFNSWPLETQIEFVILSRALAARYDYLKTGQKTYRDSFVNNYLANPKPMDWQDPFKSEEPRNKKRKKNKSLPNKN